MNLGLKEREAMQLIDTYVQSVFRFIIIDLCCMNDEMGRAVLFQEASSYSTYCGHPYHWSVKDLPPTPTRSLQLVCAGS